TNVKNLHVLCSIVGEIGPGESLTRIQRMRGVPRMSATRVSGTRHAVKADHAVAVPEPPRSEVRVNPSEKVRRGGLTDAPRSGTLRAVRAPRLRSSARVGAAPNPALHTCGGHPAPRAFPR